MRRLRYACRAPVVVKSRRTTNESLELSGVLRDAGPHGFGVEIAGCDGLMPGDRVDLAAVLPRTNDDTTAPDVRSFEGVVAHITPLKARGASLYGIRIAPHPRLKRRLATFFRKASVVGILLAITFGIVAFKVNHAQSYWYEPLLQTYSLGAAIFIFSRILLSFLYREPPDAGLLKSVSLIITAKNEEHHIADTIHHCFQSFYPSELMEVIAIDDGSTDRTWPILREMKSRYRRLRAFRFPKNKGKRHAMALGAEEARGEILIYVDSDSYPDPDSVYKIVQGFADPRVGAVSGHVLAVVEPGNAISKMESVRYYISHRIMKAAESIFGAVTCCPGAFSAYRRRLVLDVLPAWLNQRFLGTSATFGDDRSLTNFILRHYRVIYHAGALAQTYVPDTWKKFFRQQLRWKKSWARESTIAARIIWRKHPLAVFFFYIGVMLTVLSPLVALHALVLPLLGTGTPFQYLGGVFAVYLCLCLLFLYHVPARHWYYGFYFAALYIFFMSFQNYYAFATVRRNHWGTR